MNNAHGGNLVNRLANDEARRHWLAESRGLPSLTLAERFVSDCELLANGALSPLTGFQGAAEVQNVLEKMQLLNGTPWSIPIILPVTKDAAAGFAKSSHIALRDQAQRLIGILQVGETFTLDMNQFCQRLFGTTERSHPGVQLYLECGSHFLSGDLVAMIERPVRDRIAAELFLDPAGFRKIIQENQWRTVVAFQTRNPIHRAHEYLIKCVQETFDGVLVHPLVGETKKDDVPAPVRVDCYRALFASYMNPKYTRLSVLPMFMRYGGPREAIHHMIVRKNFGCTHMIVGRDHAGVGNFYGPYDAQNLARDMAKDLGISPVAFQNTYFCRTCGNLASEKTCPHPTDHHVSLSGTALRAMLLEGKDPPVEITRPEVGKILRDWYRSQS